MSQRADDDEAERPLHLAAVAAAPEQNHRDDDAGQPGEQRQAEDEPLVMRRARRVDPRVGALAARRRPADRRQSP